LDTYLSKPIWTISRRLAKGFLPHWLQLKWDSNRWHPTMTTTNGQGDVRKNEIRKQNKAEQSVEMAISHAGPFIQNIYICCHLKREGNRLGISNKLRMNRAGLMSGDPPAVKEVGSVCMCRGSWPLWTQLTNWPGNSDTSAQWDAQLKKRLGKTRTGSRETHLSSYGALLTDPILTAAQKI